jgi:hypothetical protein
VKRHLITTLGESLVNVEQALYTALAQIEACLNSRPLHPISDDPNDMLALTPTQFLVDGSMFAVPEGIPDKLSLHRRWPLT